MSKTLSNTSDDIIRSLRYARELADEDVLIQFADVWVKCSTIKLLVSPSELNLTSVNTFTRQKLQDGLFSLTD